MIIELDDEYRISVDRYNFSLQQKKITGEKAKEPGTEVWKDIAHYGGYESVLKALPKHLMQSPSIATVAALEERWIGLMRQLGERFRR